MKTRKLLTLLLALMLTVSVLTVTASAEETDTSPYLCFSWLDNQDDGWFENTDRDWYHDNRGFSMTPLDEMWHVYYYATWNGSDWEYTRIAPEDLVTENLVITPVLEIPDEMVSGENAEYYCRVTAMDWGDASICYTMDDGTELTMNVEVRRNEDGFYSSPEIGNDTYINRYMIDPFAEENSFYFGFESEFWQLKGAELWTMDDDRATIGKVSDNVYKITVKPEVVENIWDNGGFFLELDITIFHEEDSGEILEEHWHPGIFCEPLWLHEFEQLAWMRINGCDYSLVENGGWIRGYDKRMEDQDGNVWYEWRNEIVDGLPEGVSYDCDTNTLTLDNAELSQLELLYSWYDWENDSYGYNLPNGDLTIELIGENSIVNDTDWAMRLGDEVNAVITGNGSLYVNAINRIQMNEWEEYYSYPAFTVDNGADLTVAGDANVVVEISGEAMNGMSSEAETAHLTALHMYDADLTLQDNARLTTVLPEGATSNGKEAPNPDDPWYRPGGYTGISVGNSINIHDNAILSTTSLYFGDTSYWDEEVGEEVITGSADLTVTGGTLNITALANLGANERWEWDEEKQEDVFLGYFPWYHYGALEFGGQENRMLLEGGTINLYATPTSEEYESGAYAQGIHMMRGDIVITGGELNMLIPDGMALNIGGHEPENDATLTMTGGAIEVEGNHAVFEISPYGEANLSGGTIHLTSGELVLSSVWNWDEETGEEVLAHKPAMTIDGTEFTIDNGTMMNHGDLTVNSGSLMISRARTADVDPYDYLWIANGQGNYYINGGTLVLSGTDISQVLGLSGEYIQTGGQAAFVTETTEQWKQATNGELTANAVEIMGNMTVNGGILTANGYNGMFIFYDANVVLNDGAIYTVGTMNGLLDVGGNVTLNGGSLRAYSFGRERQTVTPEGAPTTVLQGHAIALSSMEDAYRFVKATLTVNGGDHVLDGPMNEGYPKSGVGLYVYDSDVFFNGGTMKIHADVALNTYSLSFADNPFAFARDMKARSLKGGHVLDFFTVAYHDPMFDEDGNPIVDENGDYVLDESYTVYEWWLEEDGEYSGQNDDIPDWSDWVVISSEKCGDGLTWDFADGVLTVTGRGDMYSFGAEAGDGLAPWYWLKESSLIGSVVMDETVTSIGANAFRDQGGIEMSIGVNVASVGENAIDPQAKLTVVCSSAGADYAAVNGMDATVLHSYANGKCSRCGDALKSVFGDVPAGQFYFDPVQWAVENGITTGASDTSFNPGGQCLRAQVVTFLWRAEGCPKPASAKNPFVDVKPTDWYYEAVLWAVEQGITTGADATHFNPFGVCNRAQVVTFLWRAQGSPEPTNAKSPFTDVTGNAWYVKPILWAVEQGITNGMSATKFGINDPCNRAQVVTFLYRTYVK